MLKRLGHNVRILEKSRQNIRESQAAGIGVGPPVVELLSRSGVTLDDVGLKISKLRFLNRDCTLEDERPLPIYQTSWGIFYYKLRAAFDGFTTDACPQQVPTPKDGEGAATYELGKRVAGVWYFGKHVSVVYEDLETGEGKEIHADLVIAADGGNSSIRESLCPGIERPYAGYFAWRGTVPLSDLSSDAQEILSQGCTIFPATDDSYIISYIIPPENGSLSPSDAIINFVWYDMCPKSSPHYQEAMTDVDGHQHRHTLPRGKMAPAAWKRRCARADAVLPPPYAEVIHKINQPFITAVSNTIAPQASYYSGRLLLVGEALSVARPHNGSAIATCANQALLLEESFKGEMTLQDWAGKVLEGAQANVEASINFVKQRKLLPLEAANESRL